MNRPDEVRPAEAAASRIFDSALVLAAAAISVAGYVYLARHLTLPVVDGQALAALREKFLPELRHFVSPEPGERMLYLTGLAWVAIVPIAVYLLLRRALLSSFFERSAQQLASPSSALVQGVLLLAGFGAWAFTISRESGLPWALARWTDAAAMAAAVAVAARVPIPRWRALRYVVLAPLALLAYRIIGCTEAQMVENFNNAHHLDLLMGAVNQVAHGRTILVNTSSQYGLAYPYVVAALLRPFGVTVTGIAVVFTLMGIAALGFLYAVIRRAARGTEPTACAELVFLGVAGSTVPYLVATIFDVNWIYYQYFPLRILWATYFFWHVGCYARATGRARRRLAAWGWALAGFAFLWNADSGLVVAVAWAATTAFDTLARDRPGLAKSLLVLAAHGAGLAATLAGALGLYAAFAWARSRQLPHFGDLLRFQRAFYGAGFYMLPMKPWEIWQAIIAVPAVTVLLCLRRWALHTADAFTTEKLFIALFGLGIFSFFQGRSHIQNVFSAAYPSALIGGLLFLDYVREGSPRVSVGFDRIAKALCLLAPGWGLATASHAVPRLYADFVVRQERPPDPQLMTKLDALRQRHRGQELPILSETAAYVHVKTGTWSPFPVSSLTECLTLEQAEEVKAAARAKGLSRFLVYSRTPPVANYLPGERLSLDQWLEAQAR